VWTRLAEWAARVRAFVAGDALDRDFDDELASHLAMLTEENVRLGMSPAAAKRAAILRLGNRESTAQRHREARGLPTLDASLQDTRYAFRALRRDFGFAAFAVLILALGIGASVTVFSVVNAILLHPLPFPQSDRLVWLPNSGTDGVSGRTVPVFHFTDLRDRSRTFSDIGAYMAFSGVGDSKLTGTGEPRRLSGVPVSRNFFSVLGVTPYLGRTFNADECRFNGPRAVMLGYAFWRDTFASDPTVVGRRLILNDAPVTVVGVLPASFDFASVFAPGTHVELYFPFPLSEETNRYGNTMAMVGRLKDGVTLQRAQAELDVLAPQIRRERDPNRDFELRVSLLRDYVTTRVRTALVVLASAAFVGMLIVCANLANLMLSRTNARQKELAVRAALGASRWRLMRQILTEGLVLSSLGALIGLGLAVAGTRTLARLSTTIPRLDSVQVDQTAILVAVALALVTGLVFGIVPALQTPALAVHASLKEGSRGSSAGRRHAWMRDALVISEIAMACVLLVGSGLLIRSFLRVLDVNLGFQPARAAALRIDPSGRYSTRELRNSYYDDALRRVKAVPGVEGAGLTDALPLGGNRSWSAGAKGVAYSRENPPPETFVRIISDGYFHAMGIPIKAGRDFTPGDRDPNARVIIVNETLARRLWPGQDPLGKTVIFVDPERQVVGVVSDVRHLALEATAGCEMYLPIRQTDDYASVDLVVRTALPPAALASAVRAALELLDPNVPTNEFRTLQQIVDKAVSPRRFLVTLLAGFSVFALILASLGIYAVVSYSVSQRTQEIGIRMALGASQARLQVGVVFQTLTLALIGIVLGVTAAWLTARAMQGLLFEVNAGDPLTFVAVPMILMAVAIAAGYVPARRASRIAPTIALRAS
jgi:predicted permease